MTITINQTTLSKALALIGKAIPTRSSMPILSCVHMGADGDHLCLTGYNREFMIRLWLKAKIDEDFAICAPHKLLAEYINQQSGSVQMRVKTSTLELLLSCGLSTATIKGMNPQDFPLPPTMGSLALPYTIQSDLLGEMIDQVTFATSKDESRPVMMAVEVTLGSSGTKMAAVDGYRLAIRSSGETAPGDPKALIPYKTLDVLSSVIASAGQIGETALQVDDNHFAVDLKGSGSTFDRTMFLGELIDAKYPDYSVIIPKSRETTMIIDRAELLRACQTAMIFARENANIIRIEVGSDLVSLRAVSDEMGESLIELPAKVNGPELTINFNGKYLIEHLSHTHTQQIVIEFTRPTRPALIRPADMEDGEEYLQVIMPMHPPR